MLSTPEHREALSMNHLLHESEHEQYAIPFPPIGVRAEIFRETALICKSMWTGKRTTFQGQALPAEGLAVRAEPVQQPLSRVQRPGY
jgi:alkanesulfonate monooxygenase SsuD/methylene tetrahydromethanopterin reductase-like flavin-dependent oxidoreductase (luciferase family)